MKPGEPDRVLATPEPGNLCPREREVLILLARGLERKQVAAQLGVSENTVKRYVEGIHSKLGIHNDADLARYAIHHKLIESP